MAHPPIFDDRRARTFFRGRFLIGKWSAERGPDCGRQRPSRNANPGMKPFRRRVLWVTTLVLLVPVGLAIYTLSIGKRMFLEYAESFLFQRMTVAQLAEQGTFRFFYATNRRPGTAETEIEERFESEREDFAESRFFDTRIEPSLGIGMLINPSDWFLNEDIQLKDVQTLERDAFVRSSGQQVQASPHRSVAAGRTRFSRGVSLGLAQDGLRRSRARYRHAGAAVRLAR